MLPLRKSVSQLHLLSVLLLFFISGLNGLTFFTDVSNVDKHSISNRFYESEYITGNDQSKVLGTQNFYADDNLSNTDVVSCNNLSGLLHTYVQRYLNLFLLSSKLKNYSPKSKDETITTILKVTLTGSELDFLKQLSESQQLNLMHVNFEKLDNLFDKITIIREERRFTNIIHNFLNFLGYIPVEVQIIVACTIILFLKIKTPLKGKSLLTILFIIINSLIMYESYIKFMVKKKKLETKIMVDSLKFGKFSMECDPKNLAWFSRFYDYVTGQDRCLEYHQNLTRNPNEEVFLVSVIFDTFAHYWFENPAKILGRIFSTFNKSILDDIHPGLRVFFTIPMYVITAILALIIALLVVGHRLHISFFGFNFRLGKETNQNLSAVQSVSVPALDANLEEKKIERLVLLPMRQSWFKSKFGKKNTKVSKTNQAHDKKLE